MLAIHPTLQNVVSAYRECKERVLIIENVSAVSPLHQTYVNNIRHTLDHIMAGLQSELDGDADKAVIQYNDAHSHIANSGPDAHQFIAGIMLKKLTSAIREAGFFEEIGNAKSQLSIAIDHYTHGRKLRTSDPEQSMDAFQQGIMICKDALMGISHPAKKEVFKFWMGVIGGGGIIGIIVIILKLLTVL